MSDTFSKLNNDPDFRALPYSEQVRVRTIVMSRTLNKDEDFLKLPDAEKARVLSSIVYRAPAFENPELDLLVKETAKAAKDGDKDARSILRNVFLSQGGVDTGIITNLLSRATTALQRNTDRPKSPEELEMEASLGVDPLLLENAQKYSKFGDYNFLVGNDGDKFREYILTAPNVVGEDTNRLRRSSQSMGTVGALAGVGIDFAAWNLAYGATAGAMVSKLMATASKEVGGRIAPYLVSKVIPQIVSAFGEGVFSVGQSNLMGRLTGDETKYTTDLKKTAMTFGLGMAIDFGMGMAGEGLAAAIGALGKNVFFKRQAKVPRLEVNELKSVLEDQVGSGAVADVLKASSDSKFQFDLDAQRYVLDKMPDDAFSTINTTPIPKTMLDARQAGYIFGADPDIGKFRVHKLSEKMTKLNTKEFDSIWKARKYMADDFYETFVTSPKELQEYLLLDPVKREMIAQGYSGRVLQNLFDETFDPSMGRHARSRVLKKAGQDVPEPYRPYITRAEADAHLVSRPGVLAQEVKIPMTEAELGKLRTFESIFKDKSSFRAPAAGADDTRGFLFIKNPAPESSYQSAKTLAQSILDNDPRLGSIEDVTADLLSRRGFDGYVHMDGTFETFFPEQVKVIYGKGFREIGRKFIRGGDVHTTGVVRASLDKTVDASVVQTDKNVLATVATKTFSGELVEEDVKSFARVLTKGSDNKYHSVSVFFSETNPGADIVNDGVLMITVPKAITDPGKQADIIERIVGDLTKVRTGKLMQTNELKSFMKKYGQVRTQMTAIFDDPTQQKKWLRDVAVDSLKMKGLQEMPDGSFTALTQDGKRVSFKNLDDATDFVGMAGMGLEGIKNDLRLQGYTLRKVQDRFVMTGPNIKKPLYSNTLSEALDKVDYRPRTLDVRFAPRTSVFTNSGEVVLKYEGGIAVGDRASVLKMLSRFEVKSETDLLRLLKIKADGRISINPAGKMELSIPEIGYHGTFDTLYEAAHLADTWWKEADSLLTVASHKGLRLKKVGGEFGLVDTYNGSFYPVKHFDEVKSVLAKFPDPNGAPEVLEGLIPGISDEVGQAIMDGKKFIIPPQRATIPIGFEDAMSDLSGKPATQSLKEGFVESSKLYRETDYYVTRWAEVHKRPEVLKGYRDVEIGRRIADTKTYELTELLEKQVFTLSDGTRMPEIRRKALYYYLSSQSPAEYASFQKRFKFGELSTVEVEAAVRLREVYNQLAKTFGMDNPEKYIFDYMPRIAQHFGQFKGAKEFDFMSELANDFFKGTGEGQVPSDLKAWFENMRTSEFLNHEVKDDALLVTLQYVQQGYKKKYMGEAWNNLYNTMKDVGDPDLFKYMNRYREKLMGTFTTHGEQVVKKIGQHFYDALGHVFKGLKGKTGADFLANLYNLNFTVNLGMKPFLAIRNGMQIYTTLGSRFGLLPVDRAVKYMLKPDDGFLEGLKRLGIISGNPPVVGAISKFDSKLSRFADKMMTWFKNSDEYTRAVAYKTGLNMWDDAVSRYQRGVIKTQDEFFKASGLDLMDPEVRDRSWKLLQQNTPQSIAGGGDYYAFNVQQETMFGYRTSQAPMTRDGVIGKMFGTYGSYPVGYRANIARALRYGTTAQKLAFVGRFLAINGALYAGFRAAKIKAPDFIPGAAAVFGGGPFIDQLYTILQAGNVTSYEGRQARGELLSYITNLGPLSPYVRYGKKMLKYLDEGDMYRAFLSATMTPTYDDN